MGAGGGGGSGYFGGGGGSAALANDAGGGGGGSGSSYLTGTSTSTSPGAGNLAGNNGDSDYAGNAGRGGTAGGTGASGTAGNTGRVVINYIAASVDLSGTSDLSDGTLVKLAVDGELCPVTGTINAGIWSIVDVPIPADKPITLWTEDGDGDIATADESSAFFVMMVLEVFLELF